MSVPLFWAGILLQLLPVAGRLCFGRRVSRLETVGLLVALGTSLYLVKRLDWYPLSFTGYDELLHWRTAEDILRTGTLFTTNPLLEVSPLHPGLEIVTTALVQLSGLSTHPAGIIVVGAARIMMMLALYLVLERLSGSGRAAALGTMTYMGSSAFIFFDSAFAYQSLGLPMGMFVIYSLLRRSTAGGARELKWGVVAALAILAIVIVHHLSSYLLTGFLILWAVVNALCNIRLRAQAANHEPRGLLGWVRFLPPRIVSPDGGSQGDGSVISTAASGRRPIGGGSHDVAAQQPSLVWPMLLALAWSIFWLFAVASITIPYLEPYTNGLLASIQQLIQERQGNRTVVPAGSEAVVYERLVAFASVGVILLVLAVGLWRWRQRRSHPSLSITLALVALVYPALPLLRLFSITWEISNRMSAFIFIAVAFVAGLGLAESSQLGRWARAARWAVLPALAIVIAGGIVSGTNPANRLPGPYLVASDNRSVDAHGLAAADWAYRVLGINNRMAGDRVQSVLMGSYGRQWMVSHHNDGIDVSAIFLRRSLRAEEVRSIETARVKYLVVDSRISGGLSLYGYYFEAWEQLVFPFIPPVDSRALDKFDGMRGVSRVLDTGDIRVYDVGGLTR